MDRLTKRIPPWNSNRRRPKKHLLYAPPSPSQPGNGVNVNVSGGRWFSLQEAGPTADTAGNANRFQTQTEQTHTIHTNPPGLGDVTPERPSNFLTCWCCGVARACPGYCWEKAGYILDRSTPFCTLLQPPGGQWNSLEQTESCCDVRRLRARPS